MEMEATGIIFAALDCDADAIEDWNRWYDLDHTPANVVLPGVQLSRRYVATPELHDQRLTRPGSPFEGGRSTFLTIYTLCEEPKATFDVMTSVRERLLAADRMFADDKKAVRDGDVYRIGPGLASPDLDVTEAEIPFLCHSAVEVIFRRGSEDVGRWYRKEFAALSVAVPGVLGLVSFASLNRPGLDIDLVFIEGDAAAVTLERRRTVPHHPDAEIVVDGAFLLMEPLRYPWAQAIRDSWLPATVA
jgi:hypothetical protein